MSDLELGPKVEYCRLLAASGLLPEQYQGKPENILWAIEYGRSLGIEPMAAINGINVIKGKPTASAALIQTLVRNAGHRLRVQADSTKAVCEIIRKDDPDYVFTSIWDMERAKLAGLTSNPSWAKYPQQMLKARAVSECARDACAEVLAGVQYTPEEMEDVSRETTPRETHLILDNWAKPPVTTTKSGSIQQIEGIVEAENEHLGLE